MFLDRWLVVLFEVNVRRKKRGITIEEKEKKQIDKQKKNKWEIGKNLETKNNTKEKNKRREKEEKKI